MSEEGGPCSVVQPSLGSRACHCCPSGRARVGLQAGLRSSAGDVDPILGGNREREWHLSPAQDTGKQADWSLGPVWPVQALSLLTCPLC